MQVQSIRSNIPYLGINAEAWAKSRRQALRLSSSSDKSRTIHFAPVFGIPSAPAPHRTLQLAGNVGDGLVCCYGGFWIPTLELINAKSNNL